MPRAPEQKQQTRELIWLSEDVAQKQQRSESPAITKLIFEVKTLDTTNRRWQGTLDSHTGKNGNREHTKRRMHGDCHTRRNGHGYHKEKDGGKDCPQREQGNEVSREGRHKGPTRSRWLNNNSPEKAVNVRNNRAGKGGRTYRPQNDE